MNAATVRSGIAHRPTHPGDPMVGMILAATLQGLVAIGGRSPLAILAAILAGSAATGRIMGWFGSGQTGRRVGSALLLAALITTVADPAVPNEAIRLLRVGVVLSGGATLAIGLLGGRRPFARRLAVATSTTLAGAIWIAEARLGPLTGPLEAVVPAGLLDAMRTGTDGEMVLPADATIVVPSPDDLGGYLAPTDTRSRDWTLNVAEGSRATLALPEDSTGWLRVAFDAAPPGPTWHVNLAQGDLPMEALHAYVVAFRARAARPRQVEVAYTEGHPPWRVLGFYQRLELDTAWQRFEQSFVAGTSDAVTQLQFNLGGDTTAVDIADVEVLDTDRHEPLRPLGTPVTFGIPYRFDAVGCRLAGPAPDGLARDRRVILVGGAAAFGIGVLPEDSYAALLTRGPATPGTPLAGAASRQVFDCAVPGSDLAEAVARGRTMAERHDAGVVLILLGPDLGAAARQRELDQALAHRGPLARLSRLLGRATRPGDGEKNVPTIQAEITRLKQAGIAEGRRYVVVLLDDAADGDWHRAVGQLAAGGASGRGGVTVLTEPTGGIRERQRRATAVLDSLLADAGGP